MKLLGLAKLDIARTAAQETLAYVAKSVTKFGPLKKSNSPQINHEINRILRLNGSVSVTPKVFDREVDQSLKAKYKSQLRQHVLTKPINSTKLNHVMTFFQNKINRSDVERLIYPNYGLLPTTRNDIWQAVEMGKLYFELQCQLSILNLPSESAFKIGNCDFSRYENKSVTSLYRPEVLEKYITSSGLENAVINVTDSDSNMKVAHNILYGGLGFMLLQRGEEETKFFLKNKIIDGYEGLMKILVT